MASARISQIFDFTGRAALVLFLAFVGTIQGLAFVGALKNPAGARLLDAASALASLLFVVLMVAMTIGRLKPIGYAQGIEPRFSALAGGFLSLLLVVLPPAELPNWLRVASLIMVIVGGILSTYVLLWLGRAFSLMAQARRLVVGGPYTIVRHPLYLCEEIAILGLAVMHLSVAAVLIVSVQWMFQLRRMTNEETVLRATFPGYAAYAAGTPRVLPRLSTLFRARGCRAS